MEAARLALARLKTNIEELIRGLWWNDFELLVELIFSKFGWQRMSVLGKTEKDIDIDMLSPVTQERAFVQVKSSTNTAEISGYYEKFKNYTQYDKMYFVFHTFDGDPKDGAMDIERLHLWDISRVSELVIHAGLVEWLIAKRS